MQHRRTYGNDSFSLQEIILWDFLVYSSPFHHFLYWAHRTWFPVSFEKLINNIKSYNNYSYFSPSQICLVHCVWLWQTLCRGIVRRQTNVAEHNPVVCMNTSSTWGTPGGCPLPQFAGLDPNVRHSRNRRKQYQNNQKTKLFWSIPWQY